jgi:DnaJ-class molecular chaperone
MRRAVAAGRRELCSECKGTGASQYGLACFWCNGKGVRLLWTFRGEDWVSETLSKIARG